MLKRAVPVEVIRALGLGLLMSLAHGAYGQARPASTDIVVDRAGRLAQPWVEREICGPGRTGCKKILINPQTHEVARVNGRWVSSFRSTGQGQEVLRLPRKNLPTQTPSQGKKSSKRFEAAPWTEACA